MNEIYILKKIIIFNALNNVKIWKKLVFFSKTFFLDLKRLTDRYSYSL